MNLPNKLTIFRMLLIPIIMIIYSIRPLRENWILWHNLSQANFIVLLLIFVGAMTDFFDGQIAREKNLVTNLGKFLDPLADKLLTCTGFIILLEQNAQNQILSGGVAPKLLCWWMVIIILAREFMVTGIRLLAAGQGKVIAASWYGKIKTTLQFITIIFLFAGGAVYVEGSNLYNIATWYDIVAKILIVAMLAVTIFSGYDYIAKNIDVLKETKKKLKK
ncbi:MAG: CDP-diacylglycerol--glycerol-3-phosphate 3-phosphatidyltransferase [Staphylococcus sp.]|jgi:CDP-diacylglycerol--glycerol-3-phosphate 3-phosphatidyltransferase|nr:CDP-diacylglycerol--glycerol-3-phosphate 3-phosphatidyltransferase [Staphylococcus sp.]